MIKVLIVFYWVRDSINNICVSNVKAKSQENWVNWIILVTLGNINQPRFYGVVVSENRLV